jgi:hypothetical protein
MTPSPETLTFDATCEHLAKGAKLLSANQRLAEHPSDRVPRIPSAKCPTVWESRGILFPVAWLGGAYRNLLTDGLVTRILLSLHQERMTWRRLMGRSTLADTLLCPGLTANPVMKAWRPLYTWNRGPEALMTHSGRETPASIKWANAFATGCEQRAWIDTPRLPRIPSDSIGQATPAARMAF